MALLRIGLLWWLLVRGMVILSKLRATFSGHELSTGGQSCTYAVRRSKRAVISVKVGIDIEPDFCFVIRCENTFDQIAKFLHLAREWQTSDAQFDGRIYIVSDDHVLLQSLSADARLRELISGLLADPRIRSLRCNSGCLWIERNGFGISSEGMDEQVAQSVAADVLPRLSDVRDHLAGVHAAIWSNDRDPGVLRERVLFAVFGACTAAGLVGFAVAQYWSSGIAPRLLLFEGSERLATYWCLPVAGALALVCVITLRGSSRLHLVLLELALTATPGVWAAARAAWMLHDVQVDSEAAQPIEVRIARSYVVQRRSSKRYHLVIADWPDSRIDPDLLVPYALYGAVASGGCLRLQWHRGRLGDPWTSALDPDRTCEGLAEKKQIGSPTARGNAAALEESTNLGMRIARAEFDACNAPADPKAVPDGATASAERMRAARAEVIAFDTAANQYNRCLDVASDRIVQRYDAIDAGSTLGSVNSLRVALHNEMVDKDRALADQFNEQIRVFNAKSRRAERERLEAEKKQQQEAQRQALIEAERQRQLQHDQVQAKIDQFNADLQADRGSQTASHLDRVRDCVATSSSSESYGAARKRCDANISNAEILEQLDAVH